MNGHIKALLDSKVKEYNNISFITNDPISVLHYYTKQQDIEIAGLFAAVFAWGNRTTIIKKAKELLALMDNAPHDFILHHKSGDLKKFLHFAHRTFNADDCLHFIQFLQQHYSSNSSLETAFFPQKNMSVEAGLIHFRKQFFSLEHLQRTEKHISSPLQKSSCKRLNMYLRWMVRHDEAAVDFGLWKKIKPAALICPLDVHVQQVALDIGLIHSKKSDWQTAVALTKQLSLFDAADPVKYDFALFSMGANRK
jgi:uncharacterized protein (TIGR02757 family)